MHLLLVKREPQIIVDDVDFCPQIIPEKKLVKAIIGRAACDILTLTKETDKKRLRREASAWIFNNSKKLGSFLWCCDIADLDPISIRSHITTFLKKYKRKK